MVMVHIKYQDPPDSSILSQHHSLGMIWKSTTTEQPYLVSNGPSEDEWVCLRTSWTTFEAFTHFYFYMSSIVWLLQ